MKEKRMKVLGAVATFSFSVFGVCVPSGADEPKVSGSKEGRSHAVPAELGPFVEMALSAPCASLRNRLVLIDHKLVFWDVAGECADASYQRSLFPSAFEPSFGSNPDNSLCHVGDSIGGRVSHCANPAYEQIFNTTDAHHENADLGLGSGHVLQDVDVLRIIARRGKKGR